MATTPHPALLRAAAPSIAVDDRCPWCDQPIPHEKFKEIQARIAAEERERTAQVERDVRVRLAKERAQLQAGAKAEVEKVQKAADKKLLDLRSTQDALLGKRLREQREGLEKATTEAVNAEKAKSFNDRLKLEGKLQQLQRQLQQKTASELGEGAEVDLFESLKSEFPDDRVTRVGKGTAGADIVHKVIHNGRICGQIVYDSKNRKSWLNDYVTKLRRDQLAAKADHAVLATQVFPAGARQIEFQDGVVIANPARVVALVHILRKHILQVDAARMSNQARDEKTSQLYEFITSDRCAQLLDQIATLSDDLLEIDVKEKKAHDATWRRRGELVRSVQKAQGTLVSEIDQIIGTADAERSA